MSDTASQEREPVLEVENLTVRYGDFVAVDQAQLTVRRGELFAFIGPNGAGKSSTMRVLATMLEPHAGTARVLGRDVVEHADWIRERLGYMPDIFGVPENLTVSEYLRLVADVHALDPAACRSAIDTSLELTDLTGHRDVLVGALSKGVRQRLYLARTLLPEPEVLILDEPASGLDPRARIDLRALLLELHAMGRTILISSHVLTELSEICDSVGIIEGGRILAQGSVAEILSRLKPWAEVRAELVVGARAALEALASEPDVTEASCSGDELSFRFHGDRAALSDLLARLVVAGYRPCSFHVDRGNMEDVFLTVTRGLIS